MIALPGSRRIFLLSSRILTLTAAGFLISSCATYPRILKVEVADDGDSHHPVKVHGLDASIALAAKDGGAVHLFLVHGMSNHPFGPEKKFSRFTAADGVPVRGYAQLLEALRDPSFRTRNEVEFVDAIRDEQFNPLVDRLAKRLDLSPEHSETRLEWYDERDNRVLGYRLRLAFTGNGSRGHHPGKLVIHLSAWAPATIPTKLGIRDNDAYPQRNDFPFNRGLKDGMVTWGLSDAAQYVGKSRQRMQLAVAKGIAGMASEAGLRSAKTSRETADRFAFGAASLGSIVTLDTLRILAEPTPRHCFTIDGRNQCVTLPPEVISAMFKGDLPLYMFANQVPLLDSAATGEAQDEAEAIESLVKEVVPGSSPSLTVLAFNDPSDMLGYKVPAIRPGGTADVEVVNVMTRNQGLGIWWFAVNPLDAHTGFAKTRAVVNLMAKGCVIPEGEMTRPDPTPTEEPGAGG